MYVYVNVCMYVYVKNCVRARIHVRLQIWVLCICTRMHIHKLHAKMCFVRMYIQIQRHTYTSSSPKKSFPPRFPFSSTLGSFLSVFSFAEEGCVCHKQLPPSDTSIEVSLKSDRAFEDGLLTWLKEARAGVAICISRPLTWPCLWTVAVLVCDICWRCKSQLASV